MKVRVITKADIQANLAMSEVIPMVKKAYRALATQQVIMPPRLQIPVEEKEGVTLFMPAYLKQENALGSKIVSVFPHNAQFKRPTINAVFLLVSSETGVPLALMEASWLTALRTGAASGVATEYLARTEAKIAAIFGAGVQGRTQLLAVSHVQPLTKVWVYDPNREAARNFVEEMKTWGSSVPSEILVAPSPQEAIKEADIICTATTATRPVFNGADVKPGTHINAIGSFTPEMQELPEDIITKAKIVVDSRPACLEEAGDIIIPWRQGLITPQDIYGEIGEIVLGSLPGRVDDEEITVFKSVGLAIQDVIVAQLILEKAQQHNFGQEVEL